MSSIKPFVHRPAALGGASAFTRTTAATSSSDESRSMTRSVKSRHSCHEFGRDRYTTVMSASASVGRGRAKSRIGMNLPSSLRGASMSHASHRGRSHSRPCEKTKTSRGRTRSILRKDASVNNDTRMGRSRPRNEMRGRSLDLERNRSQSRSRRMVSNSITPQVSSSSSHRSRSKTRVCAVRKSTEMDIMEKEREEDVLDRNLVYQRHLTPEEVNSHGKDRLNSRKHNSTIDVLKAVNSSAYVSKKTRDISAPRKNAADAIVAMLHELNKDKHDHHKDQSRRYANRGQTRKESYKDQLIGKSQSFHEPRHKDQPRSGSQSFHESTHKHHHKDQPKRKSGSNVKPHSFHTLKDEDGTGFSSSSLSRRKIQFASTASIVSFDSSTSSNFSAYDRRIEQGVYPEPSSDMALCGKEDAAQLSENEDCSLTSSFIEEDQKAHVTSVGPKKASDETSSRGSINSLVESKTKFSVLYSRQTSRSEQRSTSISPKAESSSREVSISKQIAGSDDCSLDLSIHSLPTVQDSIKSVRPSGTTRRCHVRKQYDTKPTKSNTAGEKHVRTSSESSIDMMLVDSVVKTALQKITSREEIQGSPVEAIRPVTRSHPPPPPPPRSQFSQNLSNKVHDKSIPPNNSSLQRPPPPPPRSQMITVSSVASITNDKPQVPQFILHDNKLDYGCSMNVLSPDTESDLESDFENGFDSTIPPFEQMKVSGIAVAADPVGTVNAPAKDWMAYCVTASCRESRDQKGGKKGRIFGRNSSKSADSKRDIVRSVRQMPFTDQFGDFGLYTGQVNEDGRPDGKGNMKYDNGVFYEGIWGNGCQDQKAAMQYGRIRGGFTSWKGNGSAHTKSGSVLPWNARKNDAKDPDGKVNVRGMEWTDVNGDSGRYTGEVNSSEVPHGHGIMKYDFGLIAEGKWNNGVLKENPQDRMMAVLPAIDQAMSSGRSIGPGISVGPGVHCPNTAGSLMGTEMGGAASVVEIPVALAPYPMSYSAMNSMMMAPVAHPGQFPMLAQQNAMMKGQIGMYGGGNVYGGYNAYDGGSVYGHIPRVQMRSAPSQPGQSVANVPPISEIKIS